MTRGADWKRCVLEMDGANLDAGLPYTRGRLCDNHGGEGEEEEEEEKTMGPGGSYERRGAVSSGRKEGSG